jgi:hypothetical protein
MPTYLDILPEDIHSDIYRYLYTSIMSDMENDDNFKNTKYFHKLLEITEDPLVDDLDYLGLSNIYINRSDNTKYDIFKFKKNKKEYNELFQNETAIYQKSHYTKNFNIIINNINIYNEVLSNQYKANKRYYNTFINEYIQFDDYDIVGLGITRKIQKTNFILQKEKPIECLAELLFLVIDFYNIIKNKLIQNIEGLEGEDQILTQRQRKDKNVLNDILNYHINNRFIIRFDYDIDNNSAFPILLSY